jgi:hypothetical protein
MTVGISKDRMAGIVSPQIGWHYLTGFPATNKKPVKVYSGAFQPEFGRTAPGRNWPRASVRPYDALATGA